MKKLLSYGFAAALVLFTALPALAKSFDVCLDLAHDVEENRIQFWSGSVCVPWRYGRKFRVGSHMLSAQREPEWDVFCARRWVAGLGSARAD